MPPADRPTSRRVWRANGYRSGSDNHSSSTTGRAPPAISAPNSSCERFRTATRSSRSARHVRFAPESGHRSLNDLRFSKIGSCASFLGRRCPNISTHRRSIIVRQGWPGCGHRNTAEENSENPQQGLQLSANKLRQRFLPQLAEAPVGLVLDEPAVEWLSTTISHWLVAGLDRPADPPQKRPMW